MVTNEFSQWGQSSAVPDSRLSDYKVPIQIAADCHDKPTTKAVVQIIPARFTSLRH